MEPLTQGQAIQIMIQALDIVIGKSGLTRQMIVDVDTAIKVFTEPKQPENGQAAPVAKEKEKV